MGWSRHPDSGLSWSLGIGFVTNWTHTIRRREVWMLDFASTRGKIMPPLLLGFLPILPMLLLVSRSSNLARSFPVWSPSSSSVYPEFSILKASSVRNPESILSSLQLLIHLVGDQLDDALGSFQFLSPRWIPASHSIHHSINEFWIIN